MNFHRNGKVGKEALGGGEYMSCCSHCHEANDLQEGEELSSKNEQKRKHMAIVLPKQRKEYPDLPLVRRGINSFFSLRELTTSLEQKHPEMSYTCLH